MVIRCISTYIFFFNDTATTEIYTLSLHDALPIYRRTAASYPLPAPRRGCPEHHRELVRHSALRDHWRRVGERGFHVDRKSTRLNSSHANISYAVFCLKKKKYNR